MFNLRVKSENNVLPVRPIRPQAQGIKEKATNG